MAWRASQDNDPGERWLRSRIQMFLGTRIAFEIDQFAFQGSQPPSLMRE